MHVCMDACIYVCMYVHMMYVCSMHVCMCGSCQCLPKAFGCDVCLCLQYLSMRACVRMCIWICARNGFKKQQKHDVHACVHVRAYAYTHMHARMCVVCECTYTMYVCMHVCMYGEATHRYIISVSIRHLHNLITDFGVPSCNKPSRSCRHNHKTSRQITQFAAETEP